MDYIIMIYILYLYSVLIIKPRIVGKHSKLSPLYAFKVKRRFITRWQGDLVKEARQLLYDWVDSNIHSAIPANAVWCCKDTDNSDVYIGRTSYDSAVLLVKIVPRRRSAYIAYQGKEILVTSYKVLVNLAREQATWVPGSNGFIPPNAVQCGYNNQRKKLFVGRTYHHGVQVPGYVHPFYNCIFVPFGGQEHKYTSYEVLVNQI